jgi:hypothetical protein
MPLPHTDSAVYPRSRRYSRDNEGCAAVDARFLSAARIHGRCRIAAANSKTTDGSRPPPFITKIAPFPHQGLSPRTMLPIDHECRRAGGMRILLVEDDVMIGEAQPMVFSARRSALPGSSAAPRLAQPTIGRRRPRRRLRSSVNWRRSRCFSSRCGAKGHRLPTPNPGSCVTQAPSASPFAAPNVWQRLLATRAPGWSILVS